MKTISQQTRRKLDIQGFDKVEEHLLCQTASWLRFAFALCTIFAGLGTILASYTILFILVPIAALGAVFTTHPFDLIYNYGIRHIMGTPALPKRGAPNRFACGLGSVWLIVTALMFQTNNNTIGYILGASLTIVGLLVSTIDFCIPSIIYRSVFGFPSKREEAKA
jgi:Domain of unknown function (DUF4395)